MAERNRSTRRLLGNKDKIPKYYDDQAGPSNVGQWTRRLPYVSSSVSPTTTRASPIRVPTAAASTIPVEIPDQTSSSNPNTSNAAPVNQTPIIPVEIPDHTSSSNPNTSNAAPVNRTPIIPAQSHVRDNINQYNTDISLSITNMSCAVQVSQTPIRPAATPIFPAEIAGHKIPCSDVVNQYSNGISSSSINISNAAVPVSQTPICPAKVHPAATPAIPSEIPVDISPSNDKINQYITVVSLSSSPTRIARASDRNRSYRRLLGDENKIPASPDIGGPSTRGRWANRLPYLSTSGTPGITHVASIPVPPAATPDLGEAIPVHSSANTRPSNNNNQSSTNQPNIDISSSSTNPSSSAAVVIDTFRPAGIDELLRATLHRALASYNPALDFVVTENLRLQSDIDDGIDGFPVWYDDPVNDWKFCRASFHRLLIY